MDESGAGGNEVTLTPDEERGYAILDEIEAEEAVFLETDYDPEVFNPTQEASK